MDLQSRKVQSEHPEQAAQNESLAHPAAAREFGSVEELLRDDAARHPPPPILAGRVAESIRREPRPTSFWARWFRRSRG